MKRHAHPGVSLKISGDRSIGTVDDEKTTWQQLVGFPLVVLPEPGVLNLAGGAHGFQCGKKCAVGFGVALKP